MKRRVIVLVVSVTIGLAFAGGWCKAYVQGEIAEHKVGKSAKPVSEH